MQTQAPLTRTLLSTLIILISSLYPGEASTITIPRPTSTMQSRATIPPNMHTPTHSWAYTNPSLVQNRPAHARFTIPAPNTTLTTESFLTLDAPQLTTINSSVFDWWYFDAVSDGTSAESLTVTFFTATATAFPWLPATESSVLITYLWASFANGTIFEEYVPASVALVGGGPDARLSSSGNWSASGSASSWASGEDDLSRYEVVVSSETLQVEGRLSLSSTLGPHLPCGITPDTSTLQIAPHIGWVALKPDALGEVDITIKGSRLQFQGPAYHDKNWSDQPFTDTVQSWYWGHGHLGPYSLIWFSSLTLNDPSNKAYVSGYVARDGQILVSSCASSVLTVRPMGSGSSARYPPRVGDVPDGFGLEFDLGDGKWLTANVSGVRIAGDGRYYFRWAGDMTGVVGVEDGEEVEAGLDGSAIFEQFVLVE